MVSLEGGECHRHGTWCRHLRGWCRRHGRWRMRAHHLWAVQNLGEGRSDGAEELVESTRWQWECGTGVEAWEAIGGRRREQARLVQVAAPDAVG